MGKVQPMKFTPPEYDLGSTRDYRELYDKKLRELIDGIGREKRQAILGEFRAGGVTIGDLVKKYDSDTLVISTIIADNIELHSFGTLREIAK